MTKIIFTHNGTIHSSIVDHDIKGCIDELTENGCIILYVYTGKEVK